MSEKSEARKGRAVAGSSGEKIAADPGRSARSSAGAATGRKSKTTQTRKLGRPRGAGHDDRRTAILKTAAELFAENGYEATSLDAIAERMGMHKATLYHYVKSKDSILYECLIASFADLDAVIEMTRDREIPVIERLRRFARSLAGAQNNVFGRCLVLVGERPLELGAGGDIRRFQRRLDKAVRDLVLEGAKEGSLRSLDPGLVSAMLFGALNGVPRWFDPKGRLSPEEIADAFIDMLAGGIAGTGRAATSAAKARA
ncbi:MAG: TetR/AcrR family transcriptional regulator [Burkholderiaceae bacterium]